MATKLDCPNEDILGEFLAGRSDDQTCVEIERHIETCNDCTEVLSRLELADSARTINDLNVQQHRDSEHTPEYERCLQKSLQLDFLYQPDIPKTVDRYELGDPVGHGSFGRVFRAYDPLLDSEVAVKLIQRDILSSTKRDGELLQEIRTTAALRSCPGIATVFDAGRIGRYSYIVSQFIDGPRLKDVIRNEHDEWTLPQILDLAIQIATTLAFAHNNGVVHRDIKPSNILLRDGKTYLVDFGLAFKDTDVITGRLAGTVPYMSPEQLSIVENIDYRSDIWSFGVVLYELVAGTRPFSGDSVAEIRKQVYEPLVPINDCPPTLWSIIERCLTRRKSKRYGSAAEIADELQIALAQIQSPASKKPKGEKPFIPPGMRSFNETESGELLQLLPGARDIRGVPLSVVHWKNKLEFPTDCGPERECVHYLYGPSGAGKSSFVRAALIPQFSDQTEVLWVRGSRHHLERDLQDILRQRYDLDEPSLAQNIVQLRKRPHKRDFKRLIIVVDQFEQWLTSKQRVDTDLTNAVLHACPEIHWLFVTRSEYWMELSEFAAEQDRPLVQEQNCEAIQLLDKESGRRALTKFGVWYGGFQSETLNANQRQLVDTVIDEFVQQDEYVNCARVSYLAQILSRRQIWTYKSFAEAGGLKEIEVEFLEHLFRGPKAPAHYKKLVPAIQWIIQQLLPRVDSPICETKVLPALCPFPDEVKDRALAVLVQDLQLVARSDAPHLNGQTGYRIVHEFLGNALRQWSIQVDRSSFTGRARLRLREKAEIWELTQKNEHLPSPVEWAKLSLLTSADRRSEIESTMLRKSLLPNVVKTVCVSFVFLLLGIGIHQTWQHLAARQTVNSMMMMGFEEALHKLRSGEIEKPPKFDNYARDLLTSEDVVRTKVLFACSLLPDQAATELLAEELRETQDRDLISACNWLRQVGYARKVRDVIQIPAETAIEERMLAFLLGDPGPLEDLIKDGISPDERTAIIFRLAELDPQARCLELVESSESALASIAAKALAECPAVHSGWQIDESETQRLFQVFIENPNSEIHSCCELLLTRLGRSAALATRIRELSGKQQADCNWHVSPRGITLVRVPAGDYEIGEANSAPSGIPFLLKPQSVSIEHDYWIGQAPIRQQDWLSCGLKLPIPRDSNDRNEAIHALGRQRIFEFCNELSRLEDIPDTEWCFHTANDGRLILKPEWQTLSGYRLPTEFEWEIATRAGTATSFSFGNNTESHDRFGWYGWKNHRAPITALKLPNPIGIFDTHGLLVEWCQDTKESSDLDGLYGTAALLRNASFGSDSAFSKSSARNYKASDTRSARTFRVCRSIIPPARQGNSHE